MTPVTSIHPLPEASGRAADLRARRRGGRLAVSPDVAEATLNEQPWAADAFVDELAQLPLAAWLSIGRDLSAGDTLTARKVAWLEVDTAIADHGLAMGAWYVRDALETAVCLVSRQRSCWSREERCLFAAAHGAAEAAALALLARRYVSAASRQTLCGPFATRLEGQQL